MTGEEMELISSGIAGFDAATGGGIPRGTRTLLYGGPGTGKTVFSMQFIMAGLIGGSKCAYNVLDRPFGFARRYFESFDWDVTAAEKKKRFFPLQGFPHDATFPEEKGVSYLPMNDLPALQKAVGGLAKKGIDRYVAGDNSQSFFSVVKPEELNAYNEWLLNWTFHTGITALEVVTATQVDVEGHKQWSFNLKAMQNVIQFRLQEGRREIRILKMEGTEHPLDWLPMEITAAGTEVGVSLG
jgi:KaiC/GvpD/RAD55 family RecA-like ATPase